MDLAKRARLEELRAIFRANRGVGITNEQKNEMVAIHKEEKADDDRRFTEEGIKWLTQELYFHDLIGLVVSEVPQDEYEIEARMILRELAEMAEAEGMPDAPKIAYLVHEVFAFQFLPVETPPLEDKRYLAIAKSLLGQKDMWYGK
jgi:hypothetical protein